MSVIPHPLGSSRISSLLRLIVRHGCEPRYLPRVAAVLAMSLVRQPAMVWERARYGDAIRRQAVAPAPIFIVGHWRSGTTHLQNLLSQDPQFGRVTLLQAGMPLDFLSLGPVLANLLRRSLPATRLMDNVAVSAGAPWEEEMALACAGPLSFYHVSFFPRDVGRIFRKAVLLEDEALEALWCETYLAYLRKVQYTQPGRRLLLKNPANTARIALLTQLFPGARFIHIHRNPYRVFASTVHLYMQAQQAWGFHRPDRGRVVAHVLESYPALMEAWFAQRHLIGAGALVEFRFSDLDRAPLKALRSVYRDLGIGGFDTALPRFRSYLASVEGYRKNVLPLEPEEQREVTRRWHGMFARLGYPTLSAA